MSRYIPEHPPKGSVEAYEWAEKMRQAREKKARTKARIREAGLKLEREYFGPGGPLEVKPLRNPNKKRVKKNPIAIYNPPANVAGTVYNKAIEIRAEKTGGPLKGRYKHVFGKNVKILGLDNGDVLIHHTGGKRLWITREEYERSGKPHH